MGVFPSDRIPDLSVITCKRAYALIVNLDKSGWPGSHWVALYLPKRHNAIAEYFDSYGQPPTEPNFLTLLCKYKGYVYNNIALQSPYSSVCGQYCLFYLCHRARKHSFELIRGMFHNLNMHANEVGENKYVKRYFRTNLKLFDIAFIGQQIAVSLQKVVAI